MRSWIVCVGLVALALGLGGCATKSFEKMPELNPARLQSLSCAALQQEALRMQHHERGVDEEATSGQWKQFLWGGMWFVMADEKLEHVARQRLRDRQWAVYEMQVRRGCR